MPLMDEFREEREAIKNGSFEDKAKYFWSYYKWHTITVVACIVVAIIIIADICTRKETAFYAALVNGMKTEEWVDSSQEFADYIGVDTEEYEIYFDNSIVIEENNMSDTSLASSQKLLVYTASGELDVMLGGSDVFPDYAHGDMFCDLREVLSEEQLEKYEPYFYYVDRAVIESLEAAYTDAQTAQIPTIPDPSKPEDMEEPIPVGVFVTNCSKLTDNYYFIGDYIAIGVIGNTPHMEAALAFIDYLFE